MFRITGTVAYMDPNQADLENVDPDPSKTFKKYFQQQREALQVPTLFTVLWVRNYFFQIRIPFSAEFWIRIRILLD
jgi:hypothetical protein